MDAALQHPTDMPTPRPEVRSEVMKLLTKSPAYHKLPQAQQQQVARDTAMLADTLVGQPSGGLATSTARAMADPPEQASFGEARKAVDAIGQEDFKAGAVVAGGQAAADYIKQVNFTDFVSGLIDGVFHSIVTSSIEQMEAYAKMVSDVSKSLNDFRDENTTPNQGRDHLVEQFPDVFDIGVDDFSGSPEPRLVLKDGIDQDSALSKIQQQLGEGGITSLDVSDPEAEAKLITAARSHIATARQQLLATMVLMGLNRIVVTNGKISAKINYNFSASSNRVLSRSAQAMDYARDASGNLAVLTDGEGEWDSGGKTSRAADRNYEAGKSSYTGTYDSDYYTKGKYKYTQKPVMSAMAVATDQQSDTLSAQASLAGQVEVNFKSDYLPLEKMATPEMMAALQMRSKPVDHNRPIYDNQPPPGAAAPAASAPASPAPAAPART